MRLASDGLPERALMQMRDDRVLGNIVAVLTMTGEKSPDKGTNTGLLTYRRTSTCFLSLALPILVLQTQNNIGNKGFQKADNCIEEHVQA